MKVKILRNTIASGKTVACGDVVDLSAADAKTLILMGKATDYLGEHDSDTDMDDVVDAEAASVSDELKALNKAELLAMADRYEIEGCQRMNKAELVAALKEAIESLETAEAK
jgi:mannitol-1-phosphate/altronate dehydrogenase